MIEALKQKLQSEVERLNHEISFVLPKEIEKARAHGDLRENSEYKAALERQQFAQARVHHLRLRLSKLSDVREQDIPRDRVGFGSRVTEADAVPRDRKSTRLNSSHSQISYAVFCLKKKKSSPFRSARSTLCTT